MSETQPEVIKPWFNASAQGGTCLDVQHLGDGTVQTRHSKRPEVVTDYTPGEWDTFIAGAKAGMFDRPAA